MDERGDEDTAGPGRPGSSRPDSSNSKALSPVKKLWAKAYQFQATELPNFPINEPEKFNAYLTSLEDVLDKKKSRFAPYEVAARIAILNSADAKYKESIPFYEAAMEGVRPLAAHDPGSKHLFEATGLQYANALDTLGEYDKAEEVFIELVESNPNGEHIIEFAIFLQRRKKDMLRAQMFFERALEVFPKHASVCLKYAAFMRHVRKDTNKADEYYRKATELNPNFPEALGSYASFLYGLRKNLSSVPALYQQAIDLDPFNTSTMCNYGLFLSEEQNEFKKAESIYMQALKLNPKHSNTLYNYGVMLDTHLDRKRDAESLYRRAIATAPEHAYALYNLAVLLEEEERKKGSIKSSMPDVAASGDANPTLLEIKEFYARASEADKKDPDICSDYGRFLLMRMGEIDGAQEYLSKALTISSSNEVALFHMGTLLYKNRQDLLGAYQHLNALVTVNRKHLAGRQQLARVLTDLQKELISPSSGEVSSEIRELHGSLRPSDFMTAAIEHYEESIRLASEPDRIVLEYIRAVNKGGGAQALMRCIGFVDTVLSGPSKYPDLNLLLGQVRTKLATKKK
jgi:tetratricopeptide (TPR) repeat protein